MRYVLSNPQVAVALVGAGIIADVEIARSYADKPKLDSRIMELVRTVRMYDEEQLWPSKW